MASGAMACHDAGHGHRRAGNRHPAVRRGRGMDVHLRFLDSRDSLNMTGARRLIRVHLLLIAFLHTVCADLRRRR